MSRFHEELNVIPRTAWVVALVLYLGFVGVAYRIMIPDDPNLASWPSWGKVAFATLIPLFLLALVLLIGYVNGDARRRGMRYVLWTLLAIFIPNAIGIILYFIMRDPPMKTCQKCSQHVRGSFAFCPACGAPASPRCATCGRAVEPGWSHCPSCGKPIR